MAFQQQQGEQLYELCSVPVVSEMGIPQGVSCVVFDGREELLWAGTDAGFIHQFHVPGMHKFASFKAHTSQILGMCNSSEGVVSVSREALRHHASGGYSALSYRPPVADMTCTDLERANSTRAIVGHEGKRVSLVDLVTGKEVASGEVPHAAVKVSGGGRLLACADSGGKLSLMDPRSNLRVEHSLETHQCGVIDMDMRDQMIVTCGRMLRGGHMVIDTLVKVFDVRAGARAFTHLPFKAGPTMLRIAPHLPTICTVGSGQGMFSCEDIMGGGVQSYLQYRVDCEGDVLACCDQGAAGEALAFGDTGGYVHLWSAVEAPKVNLYSIPTELAHHPEPPAVPLRQHDGFAAAHIPWTGEPLLSGFDTRVKLDAYKPPRVVDDSLLRDMKVSDFVGFVPNPHFKRGGAPGAGARAVHTLRNRRIQAKGKDGEEAEETAKEAEMKLEMAMGGKRIPKGYSMVEIQQSSSRQRFEEFDFSYYNKTKFAGLENDLANCYCNSLLQVLYFIPPLRDAASHQRWGLDFKREFSLIAELGYLFRMLHGCPKGSTVQAQNLLRALRQIREAGLLGLLEGADELETSKDHSLPRRLQSFTRFLLEQLR
eukprot:CAMPEP_0182864542 /NCGR_PEP_ID=MMETSP0034_2-20130328/7223_1 /TAXON_ID=156128 /ORGANISM="Nephroselmis pyriformis, Strain CCMP717" /LENGTH=596 /DNA_ID=CAMNT_0024996801 /DNA_START=83 /DNA_END=1869 /DNA_ORIENTATION=-